MRIVILADNVAGLRGLLAEHGLSLWLETRGRRILFDTGQGLALGHNAAALGVRLDRGVRCVVPCHCTGLPATAALARELGDRCIPGRVGAVYEFDD